jgi:hypothetical protein
MLNIVPLLRISTFMVVPAYASLIYPHPQPNPQNLLSRNTKSVVESVSGRGILGRQRCNDSLGSQTLGLSLRILRNTTVIDEVVADGVGDDVGVQGVALSLGDGWVDWEEGAFGGFAAGSSELEVHGWVATTE